MARSFLKGSQNLLNNKNQLLWQKTTNAETLATAVATQAQLTSVQTPAAAQAKAIQNAASALWTRKNNVKYRVKVVKARIAADIAAQAATVAAAI
jgi:hypothetical protein